MTFTTTPLFLVSCVAGKLEGGHAARDLYCSDWFKKARGYVEAVEGDWLILSAGHGVVDPLQTIWHYDTTLHEMEKADRQAWAESVMRQLRQRGQLGRPVIILAGERYREFLEPLLNAVCPEPCQVPLRGLGIGQQKSALLAMTREAERERAATLGDPEMALLLADLEMTTARFNELGRRQLTRRDMVRQFGANPPLEKCDLWRAAFEIERRQMLADLAFQREELVRWICARRKAIPHEKMLRAKRKARFERAARRVSRNIRHLALTAFAPLPVVARV